MRFGGAKVENEATFHEWHGWRQVMGREESRWSHLHPYSLTPGKHTKYQSAGRFAPLQSQRPPIKIRRKHKRKSTVGEKASLIISWLERSSTPLDGIKKLGYEFHLTPYTHWLIAPSPRMLIAASITPRTDINFHIINFYLPSNPLKLFGSIHTSNLSVITCGKLGDAAPGVSKLIRDGWNWDHLRLYLATRESRQAETLQNRSWGRLFRLFSSVARTIRMCEISRKPSHLPVANCDIPPCSCRPR